jgi:signal transduction histidine kinase
VAVLRERAVTRTALHTIAATGRDARQDTRRIGDVLRGHGDDHTGQDDRRRVGLTHLEPLIDRATAAGLTVDLHVDGPPEDLSPAVDLTLFRLVQEGLTNDSAQAGTSAPNYP